MAATTGKDPVYSHPVLVGSERLKLSGELHRLITFLNQTLSQDKLEFGLRKEQDGAYVLTIYRIQVADTSR